ncbi:hypothetical protein AMTRI_Chr08g163550 [Amborella trichopoda]|uniref:DYW domain-containing protein n=1 Tax=Amborella trichopoda TaxID=13333 RepID=W1P7U7_AMBTC|nr:pentatricopeptide repeat-containing protein At5g42450, mitochondrial [Amborella trichopoda]ERN05957.1 hypothetical protein AMTR_s00145p00084930 [Amborella trichopoda]|eukprot:XP_006844282.1 pentatricopeptide repeat-containing protein At5g42450, mitochondrial [Amborella trichopoda]
MKRFQCITSSLTTNSHQVSLFNSCLVRRQLNTISLPQTSPTPNLETQKIHAHLFKTGIPLHSSNLTQLVRSYCKLKSFTEAHKLFDEIAPGDLVSCTAIIGALARHGRGEEALCLFKRMHFLCIMPNQFTFGTVIHVCTNLCNLAAGEQLHGLLMRMGLQSDVFVGTALLDFYAKLGKINEAKSAFADIWEPNVVSFTALIMGYLKNEMIDDGLEVFRVMPNRNVVSWNAMIAGLSQAGHNEMALNLFVEMCREGERPNQSTYPCVFRAAANVAALGIGMHLHAHAVKLLDGFDVFVGNSLISFYAKCGNVEDGKLVFNQMQERNIVSWNALISGYAQNGQGSEGVNLFKEMCVSGFKPNSVTVLCLLFACNHGGLIEEGCAYFESVKRENPQLLGPKHYASMVDLLSRSGNFEKANKFLIDLPFDPGIGFWKSLLGGCQIHSNIDLSNYAAQRLLDLDPEDVSSYVMLSNVFAVMDQWQDVSKVRRLMKNKGMKRIPGCSWIEIRDKVHAFVNGDRRHPEIDEIYRALIECYLQLKEAGYAPKPLLKFECDVE